MRLFLLIIVILSIGGYFIFESRPETYENNPTLKLVGISWNENVGVAIINGKLLKESEVIEGYRVVKIEKDNVILSRNKQEFALTHNGLIRRTVKQRVKDWWQEISW